MQLSYDKEHTEFGTHIREVANQPNNKLKKEQDFYNTT